MRADHVSKAFVIGNLLRLHVRELEERLAGRNDSTSLAADYLRRSGSYIGALKLILADLGIEQDADKGELLCDTMNELRVMCGQAPISEWTHHEAYSWRFWLDRVKAAADDIAMPRNATADKSPPEK